VPTVKYWAERAKGREQMAKSREAMRRGSGEAGRHGDMRAWGRGGVVVNR